MSTCGKSRTGKTPMPFDCERLRDHDGNCSPYTLAPTCTQDDYLRLLHTSSAQMAPPNPA